MAKMFILDCETLSTRDNAVVLSIGMTFITDMDNANTSYNELLTRGIHFKLNREEQIKKNRHISQSTVDWWKSQGDAAKTVLSSDGALPFYAYFTTLKTYLEQNGYSSKTDYVFSRGLIDQRWLDTLCEDFGVSEPLIPYWNFRETRTALELLTGNPNGRVFIDEKTFIKHNALHDCAMDALRLIDAFSK